jgi:hypothetical protein
MHSNNREIKLQSEGNLKEKGSKHKNIPEKKIEDVKMLIGMGSFSLPNREITSLEGIGSSRGLKVR